jgi:Cdc6-like AAA superfamily ATPase
MYPKLLFLEGLDGTGKTYIASNLIKLSTYKLPINYVYFQKKETEEKTCSYFYDVIEGVKYFDGVVIIDRSILSTYAYGTWETGCLENFTLLNNFDLLIVFFDKIYDYQKLPSNYEIINERYLKGIDELINKYKIPVIITDASTFLKKIDSLEKLDSLFKLKTLPY